MPIQRELPRHSSATRRRARPLLAWVLMAVAGSAAGLAPGAHVPDFTLTDETGATHELYALSAKRAVVIMTQSNGCPIVRLAVPALREIRDRYPKRDIEFLLLNPTLQDSAESVAREVAEFNFGLPVMLDPKQKVGETLGVNRTAEVYVIDPKSWTLVYHGPIDDRLNYESQRPVHHRYLSDALDAMLAGKPVAVASASSPGCLINFPNRKHG
jgi:peroxiredoxin